jgi:Domain of unknown function (DUF4439)
VSDSGTVGEVTETSRDTDTDAVVLSRRVLLGAGLCSVLALASGCGGDLRTHNDRSGPGAAATGSPLNSDIRLLTRAIADEEALGAFCTAAARRFPDQRPLLAGLGERQRLHVTRFRSSLTDLNPPVNRIRPALPRRSEDLQAALAALALDARNARSADCVTATSGLLAELFASVAASHAETVQSLDPASAGTTVSVPAAVTAAEALQPCLAAEHAAVFGYGLLGGVLSAAVSEAPAAKAALTSYDAHRGRRDALTELIEAAGGKPVAAEAAYDAPFPVAGVPSARRLARYLEARCATVYARATAVTTQDTRAMVSGTLLDCAVRGARWGSGPTAFPGLDKA